MTDQTQTPKVSDNALALVSKSVESLQGVVDVLKRDGALTDEIRQNVAAVSEALSVVAKLEDAPVADAPPADAPPADAPAAPADAPAAPAAPDAAVAKSDPPFKWALDMNDLASNDG